MGMFLNVCSGLPRSLAVVPSARGFLEVVMTLFNDDPAFPFELTAIRCHTKEGDLVDRDTKEKRHYNSFVVQCNWVGLDGLPAICLAKPVEGYRPDKALFEKGSHLRLAVTSSSSSGGMLTLRFNGVEVIKSK